MEKCGTEQKKGPLTRARGTEESTTKNQSVQAEPLQYHFFKRPAGEIESAAHPI